MIRSWLTWTLVQMTIGATTHGVKNLTHITLGPLWPRHKVESQLSFRFVYTNQEQTNSKLHNRNKHLFSCKILSTRQTIQITCIWCCWSPGSWCGRSSCCCGGGCASGEWWWCWNIKMSTTVVTIYPQCSLMQLVSFMIIVIKVFKAQNLVWRDCSKQASMHTHVHMHAHTYEYNTHDLQTIRQWIHRQTDKLIW